MTSAEHEINLKMMSQTIIRTGLLFTAQPNEVSFPLSALSVSTQTVVALQIRTNVLFLLCLLCLFWCFHSDSMPKRMALICFLSLVMLMSILGNLLVMVAVCKDRQLRWDGVSFPLHIITLFSF